MSRRNNQNRQNNDGKVPEIVKEFAKITFEKYKKSEKDYYTSKKKLRRSYYDNLVYDLPVVIDWLLKFGHQQKPEIQEIKNLCYKKFAGEDGPRFIKHLQEYIKSYGTESIEKIELFPIILHEIIGEILAYNAAHAGEVGECFDPPDELFDLAEIILKKRMKKAKKKGIPEDLAFDLLGIIPVTEACKYGAFFRTRSIFDIMYQYAEKSSEINFGKIIKFLYDKDDYGTVIEYALQERKEKYKNFNEFQKKLFNDINEWVFDTLEDMSSNEIENILRRYINIRKRDASQGRDSNRRYYLASLPSSVYPSICDEIERLKKRDSSVEKFL